MSEQVRVRFCPSPTGTPHVGLIRSCLFNWVYAKHTGGKFVFRIEDTDAARDSEDSYKMIIEALKWLGMKWDEGVEIGGPDAPYRQSERMDIYKSVADKLVNAGFAYKCFSTAAEIDARNEANNRPKQMGYDNFDRNLTQAQIAAFEAEGREYTIRMKMPESDITFTDIVRGEITFKSGTIPDYVIVRANGQPLYTLVNPVDDALMNINCILRGEDLLSSTPRQIVLWRALHQLGMTAKSKSCKCQETTPREYIGTLRGELTQQLCDFVDAEVNYGHLPYVMGEGNKKLSKRDPESNLFLHREKGMIPEGLINYLALLGWSIAPDRDVFSVSELIESFDPNAVLANPARFDLKKCTAINAEHIRLLDEADFRERLVPYLHGSVSQDFVNLQLLQDIANEDPTLPKLQMYPALVSARNFSDLTKREQEILTKAAPLIQTRIQLLSEAREMLAFLFSDSPEVTIEEDAQKQLDKVGDWRAVIERAIEVLSQLNESDWNSAKLQEILSHALSMSPADEPDYPGSLNLKPRDAYTPVRVGISGKRVSPPLFESLEILGKELALARLEKALA